MSAAKAVMAARAAGIHIGVEGDALVLEASAPPPPTTLELLARHKAAIISWLRPGADGWSGEDWQAFFDERAGVLEFDAGAPRSEAEANAFACCISEWLNRNPVCSPPGCCAGCGAPGTRDQPLLPYGVDKGRSWLHARCWPVWFGEQKRLAVAALTQMGLPASSESPNDFGKNGGH